MNGSDDVPIIDQRGIQKREIKDKGISERGLLPGRASILAAQKSDVREIPCTRIPLDWKKLKKVLAKLEISKEFGISLVKTEYETWIKSELLVDFTLRDQEIEVEITESVLDQLKSEGIADEDLGVLRRFIGKKFKGRGSEADLLDAAREAFGAEREEAFKRVRPLLLRYITVFDLRSSWEYYQAKIPVQRSDHPSLMFTSEHEQKESRSNHDVEGFREDANQHLTLIRDVIPLLATCDEKLRKQLEKNRYTFDAYYQEMETFVKQWRKEPRTKAGLVKPNSYRITEQALEKMKLEGVPLEVVQKLRRLLNRSIVDEDQFLLAVEEAIEDKRAFLNFKGLVLANAEKSGGTIPVSAPDAYPIRLQFAEDNPEKTPDCLAKKEFCPIRIHFELSRPETVAQVERVLVEPKEMERAVNKLEFLMNYAKGDLKLTIRGFTDRSGERVDNRALSKRRAQWVHARLKQQIQRRPFKRVDVIGLGEKGAMVGPELNPEDRFADIIVEPLK